MKKRALRRFHRERLKKRRRYYWGRDLSKEDPNIIGVAVNTPTVCSCHMCGNARKYYKEPTLQEKKNINAAIIQW